MSGGHPVGQESRQQVGGVPDQPNRQRKPVRYRLLANSDGFGVVVGDDVEIAGLYAACRTLGINFDA